MQFFKQKKNFFKGRKLFYFTANYTMGMILQLKYTKVKTTDYVSDAGVTP